MLYFYLLNLGTLTVTEARTVGTQYWAQIAREYINYEKCMKELSRKRGVGGMFWGFSGKEGH